MSMYGSNRLFTEEPVDFVRKVHDPLGDWLSPLIAATNLLQVCSLPTPLCSVCICDVALTGSHSGRDIMCTV